MRPTAYRLSPIVYNPRPMLRRAAIIVSYAAAAVIGVLAVVTPLRLGGDAAAQRRTGAVDLVSAYLDTFQTSRTRLADQQVVGYYSSRTVDITKGGEPEKRYYLAQYALAPLLIDHRSKGYRLVLINLPPDRVAQLDALRRQPNIATLEPADVPGRAIVTRREP